MMAANLNYERTPPDPPDDSPVEAQARRFG